jgi:hypothetical protein
MHLTLHMIVLGLKICVMFTPLRHDLTSGIPDPALQGSIYTCSVHIYTYVVIVVIHVYIIAKYARRTKKVTYVYFKYILM